MSSCVGGEYAVQVATVQVVVWHSAFMWPPPLCSWVDTDAARG